MDLSTIPELFKQTFQIYRERLPILFKITVLNFLANVLLLTSNLPGISGQSWSSLVDAASFIVSWFLTSWMSVVLIRFVAKQDNNLEKNAFSVALDGSLRYVFLSFLATFSIFGGLILFIFPAIYMFVWLSFTGFILVLENKGVVESIYRSRLMVKGIGWQIFVRLFAIYFIPNALWLILILIKIPDQYSYITSLLSNLMYSVFLPFEVIYTFLIYQQVKTNNLQETVSIRAKFLFWGSFIAFCLIATTILITSLAG